MMMSAFGGKADMAYCQCKCPLMTQSGHSGRKVLAVKSCRVLAGGHRERVLRIPHSKS
jgi:hypothetical protein